MSHQFLAIVKRTVKRDLIYLVARNVNLAGKDGVRCSIEDFVQRRFVFPASGQFTIRFANGSGGVDDSCAVAGEVIICVCSIGPGRWIAMVACVVACCTANDGDGIATASASATANTAGVTDVSVRSNGIRQGVSCWAKKNFDRCGNRSKLLALIVQFQVPLLVEILLFDER